jgi:DegV family protein with EDD domain
MPRIRIVTDSACDLSPTFLEEFGIKVAPHAIRWGDEAYLQGVDITSGSLIERMRATPGEWPQVEGPDVDHFAQLYRELRDESDGVLSVHVSSKISEGYANAMVAREAFGPLGQGGPFPVAVIDSQQTTMGLGWMVLVLARAARSGSTLTDLVSRASRLTESCHVAFFVERTEGLQRAGRGLRAHSGGESLNNFRPLFHLDEGQAVIYERTRTRSKARDALYNFVEDFPKIGELAVFHTGAFYDLEHLMTRIGAIYPRERVLIYQAGPAVAAWVGPDALGVAVIEADELT